MSGTLLIIVAYLLIDPTVASQAALTSLAGITGGIAMVSKIVSVGLEYKEHRQKETSKKTAINKKLDKLVPDNNNVGKQDIKRSHNTMGNNQLKIVNIVLNELAPPSMFAATAYGAIATTTKANNSNKTTNTNLDISRAVIGSSMTLGAGVLNTFSIWANNKVKQYQSDLDRLDKSLDFSLLLSKTILQRIDDQAKIFLAQFATAALVKALNEGLILPNTLTLLQKYHLEALEKAPTMVALEKILIRPDNFCNLNEDKLNFINQLPEDVVDLGASLLTESFPNFLEELNMHNMEVLNSNAFRQIMEATAVDQALFAQIINISNQEDRNNILRKLQNILSSLNDQASMHRGM